MLGNQPPGFGGGLLPAARRHFLSLTVTVLFFTMFLLPGAKWEDKTHVCAGAGPPSQCFKRPRPTEALSPTQTTTNNSEEADATASFADGLHNKAAFEYYEPIMRSLAENGPPAPSCLPSEPGKAAAREPKWDTVLIIAQGRSGSTSMLRLLNTFPCYNIRGENDMLLTYAVVPSKFSAETFRSLEDRMANRRMSNWNWTSYKDPGLPSKPAFFNRWNRTRVLSALDMLDRSGNPGSTLRKLVVNNFLEHIPGHLTGGFKEIRYFTPVRTDSKSHSLNFLDEWVRLYPRTAFVLLSREVETLRRSGWWRNLKQTKAESLLLQQSEWLDEVAQIVASGERYGPNGSVVKGPNVTVAAARIKHEDLIVCNFAEGSTLRRLYETLGELMDEDNCRMIMSKQAGEAPIALSSNDFGDQGKLDWEYGYRTIRQHGDAPGSFTLLNMSSVNVGNTTELEYCHQEQPQGSAFLRHTRNTPFVTENGTQVIPCRRWTYSGTQNVAAAIGLRISFPRGDCNFVLYAPERSWKHEVERVSFQVIQYPTDGPIAPRQVLEFCVAKDKYESCDKLQGLDVVLTVTRLGLDGLAVE
jgi:hypothetical protein